MSVEDIKKTLAALSVAEQNEVAAYLSCLRRIADPEYRARLDVVMSDKAPEHWLTPEEFEKRLDAE